MESLVRLTVKTPNQGIEDIQINCDLDWTVRKLKEYLQDVYPSNPESSSQRLIYLGRLLQDHLSLKEVFGEWGARTVHIVCNEANEKMLANNSTKADSSTTTTTNVTNVASGSDGLRFRGCSSMPNLPSNQSSPDLSTMTPSGFPVCIPSVSSTPSAEYHQLQAQLAQQYQYQMHQYYQQWHQWQQAMGGGQWPYSQYTAGTFPTPPVTPISQTPSPTTPFSPQPNIAQPQPVIAQPQAVPPQAEVAAQVAALQPNRDAQNAPMNAGPGGVGMEDEEDDNENGRNRDWLDWVYTSLRALMLLSIIYFYSSTSRFVLVTILAFLLYLYQNGWFAPRRVAPPAPVAEPIVNPPAHENVEQDNINGQHDNADGVDNRDNSTNDQSVANEPPRPTVIRIVLTFFVSFLTSLIPSPPPAIAAQ